MNQYIKNKFLCMFAVIGPALQNLGFIPVLVFLLVLSVNYTQVDISLMEE